MMRFSLFLVFVCVAISRGAEAEVKTVPELEGARAAYQRALAEIRADRDKQAAPTNRTYAGRLAELRQKLSAEGEAEAASAVQAEEDRVSKGIETTPEEVRQMAGLLRILRTSYEKERSTVYFAAAKREAQAHAGWASGLEKFHAQLIKTRQLEKAALVQAERNKLARPPALFPPPAPPAPVVPNPVAPPPAAETMKLDPRLADRIKTAIAEKTTVKTDVSGAKKGDSNVPEDGALLIGFELSEFNWKGKSVKSLDPIFLTREGVFRGVLRGKHARKTTVVQARDGYAVAGLNVYSHDRLAGLQVVFMKIDAAAGKLDANATYTSNWFGTQGPTAPTQLGGDGRLVVGVHGARGADADTIGLVMMP
jgi:hypothetical protein